MNIENIIPNLVRFFSIALLQAFVFHSFAFQIQGVPLGKVLIFPLFIAYLPLTMHSALVVLLSFFLGISIDLLANSPGVYASATTFVGFARMIILNIYEPRGGYKVNTLMSHAFYSRSWYYKTMSWMLVLSLLSYFYAEIFQISKFGFILLNVAFSFVTSGILILLISFIISPKK